MWRSRIGGFPLLMVLAALALTVALYPALPETYAVHWDIEGNPNGFQGKPFAFGMPLLMLVVHLLVCTVPDEIAAVRPEALSPQRIVHNSALLLMLAIQAFILLSAADMIAIEARSFTLPSLGLFFVVLGNYLPKVRRNAFIGIRTPWTLMDEEVWLRTHRLGGKVFVVAGVVSMLSALGGETMRQGAILFIVFTAVVLTAYSFVLYRRLHPSS